MNQENTVEQDILEALAEFSDFLREPVEMETDPWQDWLDLGGEG